MVNRVAEELSKLLPDHQIVETIVVRKLDDMETSLNRLKRHKRLQCVIVGGGDGTLITVLDAMKDRHGVTYGFLPLGTSNTFVRSLGIPLTYEDAVKIIQKGYVRKSSLGEINGRIFANMAGIGLPVQVSDKISNTAKRYLGTAAYVTSGIHQLAKHEAFKCEVRTPKETITFTTHHLLIANGPYHGHIPVTESLSVHDDKLMLISFGTDESKLRYAKSMIRLGLERHLNDPDTRIFPITTATITTEPEQEIEADGEVIAKTPAKVQIKKSAIRVFVPAEKSRSRK